LADQDWIGLAIFKNFGDFQKKSGLDRIQFHRTGLASDWKISQSAHLWRAGQTEKSCSRFA